MTKVKILEVNYDNITKEEALDASIFLIGSGRKANIFFLNADYLYKTKKDAEFRDILNSADLVLPDGIGFRVISGIFGYKMLENCNGSDFSPILIREASKSGNKIFLLGGKEGIAQKAANTLKKDIKDIKIVGIHSGYFDNDYEIIKKINDSGADILFVAMGAPLQEKWIYKNREKLNPKLCLGVGALLDYLSGNIPRAPKFMRIIHLEWLWRIFMEPKRMFNRYIIKGTKLFWLVFKAKFSNKLQ